MNSYEHDESGITTEDPLITARMQEKRLRKEKFLSADLQNYPGVSVYGVKDAAAALVCWGSNKGVCVEAAEERRIKVIHLSVLWPFPVEQFRHAAAGVNKLICVEHNATGQLADLMGRFGFHPTEKILRYDGRPFAVEELIEELNKVAA